MAKESGHEAPVRLTEREGRRACAALYWEPTAVEILAGYDDRSFLVRDHQGLEFVLKIASPAVDGGSLELERSVLEHLAATGETRFPRSVASRRGRHFEELELAGAPWRVRMLTYLPGLPLGELPSRPTALLEALGRLVGRMDRALAEFEGARVDRMLDWDIVQVAARPGLAKAIVAASARRRVEAILERYVREREVRGSGLRRSLIHNDVNDYNVLVSSRDPAEARIAGLIDFGDLVETDTVVELAVAMAYAGLGSPDPWAAAQPVLAGYHAEYPLTDDEIEILFAAFCARLALSVCMSARRKAAGLADAYALISEAPAWAAIEWAAGVEVESAGEIAHRTIEQTIDRPIAPESGDG